jgi:hypothetical protein
MFNPDYHEILSLFSEEKVQYLLVGAYAHAAHGNPRATEDMDVWVNPTSENASRVYRALTRFGAAISELDERDLAQPQTVLQVGVLPQRVDIMTELTGVDDFDEAYLQREEVEIEGVIIPVLSRRLLIQNKRALGRPQDLADLISLEQDE